MAPAGFSRLHRQSSSVTPQNGRLGVYHRGLNTLTKLSGTSTGGARKGSTVSGVARNVPRPVQTSSLKKENGGQDVTAVLVNRNGGKKVGWGASAPAPAAATSSSPPPLLEPTPADAMSSTMERESERTDSPTELPDQHRRSSNLSVQSQPFPPEPDENNKNLPWALHPPSQPPSQHTRQDGMMPETGGDRGRIDSFDNRSAGSRGFAPYNSHEAFGNANADRYAEPRGSDPYGTSARWHHGGSRRGSHSYNAYRPVDDYGDRDRWSHRHYNYREEDRNFSRDHDYRPSYPHMAYDGPRRFGRDRDHESFHGRRHSSFERSSYRPFARPNGSYYGPERFTGPERFAPRDERRWADHRRGSYEFHRDGGYQDGSRGRFDGLSERETHHPTIRDIADVQSVRPTDVPPQSEEIAEMTDTFPAQRERQVRPSFAEMNEDVDNHANLDMYSGDARDSYCGSSGESGQVPSEEARSSPHRKSAAIKRPVVLLRSNQPSGEASGDAPVRIVSHADVLKPDGGDVSSDEEEVQQPELEDSVRSEVDSPTESSFAGEDEVPQEENHSPDMEPEIVDENQDAMVPHAHLGEREAHDVVVGSCMNLCVSSHDEANSEDEEEVLEGEVSSPPVDQFIFPSVDSSGLNSASEHTLPLEQALAQQRKILDQVHADRRNAGKKDLRSKETKVHQREVTMVDNESEIIEAEPGVVEELDSPKRQTRSGRPRTKGVLFKLLPDGTFVNADLSDEELERRKADRERRLSAQKDKARERAKPKVEVDVEADGAQNSADERLRKGDAENLKADDSTKRSKPFVPAPPPAVSAWTAGPPPGIIRSVSVPGSVRPTGEENLLTVPSPVAHPEELGDMSGEEQVSAESIVKGSDDADVDRTKRTAVQRSKVEAQGLRSGTAVGTVEGEDEESVKDDTERNLAPKSQAQAGGRRGRKVRKMVKKRMQPKKPKKERAEKDPTQASGEGQHVETAGKEDSSSIRKGEVSKQGKESRGQKEDRGSKRRGDQGAAGTVGKESKDDRKEDSDRKRGKRPFTRKKTVRPPIRYRKAKKAESGVSAAGGESVSDQ